ncbi:hypothetical protein FH972_023759 [Carpinus fangiana]|uniref:Uncharacterized protein n=1 Tax=Carpinus fangiana TaxID=176857 RepID=A0A5N6KW50_9ROSI|nr:hypothetical protein FH972_023759 [Carpinus fangiana]
MSWTASFSSMTHHSDPHTVHNLHAHSVSPNMPAISEDEVIAEADEPSEKYFVKSTPHQAVRRESLLTTALHTDSESHDESVPHGFRRFDRMASRSSTCSTWSVHTDLTSDDGRSRSPVPKHSAGSSPIRSSGSGFFKRPDLSFFRNMVKDHTADAVPDAVKAESQPKADPPKSVSESSEPAVESVLGRKRCISFRCGASKAAAKPPTPEDKPADTVIPPTETETKPGPPKRVCSLRFECPTRISVCSKTSQINSSVVETKPARRHSPPPLNLAEPLSPASTRRSHRDSDSTIKNESPKSIRSRPALTRGRSLTKEYSDITPSDATKFHEFASSDDDPEDWVQEQTVHRSRLTVNDTLKKENEIRHLGEEVDEEEALDEEEADDMDDDEDDMFSDDEVSDGGFQTDDEEGFAESDDESDDGSDYEWWAPRRSRAKSPAVGTMLPVHAGRPTHRRKVSEDANISDSSAVSPGEFTKPSRGGRKATLPLPIRPATPELPDSTDFVCGTLDEDRPLEEAYVSCMEQRRLAKHRAVPQDIDPTFPTSDHEDDSDNDDRALPAADESDHPFMQGGFENLHGDTLGRKASLILHKKRSPPRSPKRLKSPAPMKRKGSPTPVKQRKPSPAPVSIKGRRPSPAPISRRSPTPPRGRSPTPHLLFDHSPRRGRSPAPTMRLFSPPPSRRGSITDGLDMPATMILGTAFLATRPQLTHTASLPRTANPFIRQLPSTRKASRKIGHVEVADVVGSEDEGEPTERDEPYSRGAIDIKQGLERKRLRRRQKFHEKYLKKEERKMQRGEKAKRPQPGKGAQRMRQIGIECSIYRGKRVESL